MDHQLSFSDAAYISKKKTTRKVRYRGLAKNAAQLFTLFALANVYLARKELIAT